MLESVASARCPNYQDRQLYGSARRPRRWATGPLGLGCTGEPLGQRFPGPEDCQEGGAVETPARGGARASAAGTIRAALGQPAESALTWSFDLAGNQGKITTGMNPAYCS